MLRAVYIEGFICICLFSAAKTGIFLQRQEEHDTDQNLTLTHKYDLRTILEDFQLVPLSGDKAVIIGEEGNGKSTLMKWIYCPGLVEDYVEAEGERICRGERLGYLPQELPDEEKEKSVYEFFCEEELFWETDNQGALRLAGELLLPAIFLSGAEDGNPVRR